MAFSNKGILIVEVLFDKYLWEEMLVKLHKFYSKQMIPKILTQLTKNLLGWIWTKLTQAPLKVVDTAGSLTHQYQLLFLQ